ncbi:hypothetical protein LOD99_15702 [Oopsacas minuta]|uniref:TNFR-Cys domain-containing protein n=1 Tax=Oopsacas minuta TaxID=111878 RepID=A0AAV7KA11_9METZ|nr:hypothetical protein LOD99_15702 [Oopsacas minuta]
MLLKTLLFIGVIICECLAIQCPRGLYSIPYKDGCVVCSPRTNVTANNTLCRMCDPYTHTVGEPTGNLTKCSCVGLPTNNKPCFPFNTTFIPTTKINGNRVMFVWKTIHRVKTLNDTIFGKVTGYKISGLHNGITIFTQKLPSMNSTYCYTFSSNNITYEIITELEANLNNYSYYGLPYRFNLTIQPITTIPNTISPAAESVIITFAVILMIIFMVGIVLLFICTVMAPCDKYCKRGERFTFNLDTSDPQLRRVNNRLDEGFTSIYQQDDILMDELNRRDSGELSYFINPYLAVNTTEIDSDN